MYSGLETVTSKTDRSRSAARLVSFSSPSVGKKFLNLLMITRSAFRRVFTVSSLSLFHTAAAAAAAVALGTALAEPPAAEVPPEGAPPEGPAAAAIGSVTPGDDSTRGIGRTAPAAAAAAATKIWEDKRGPFLKNDAPPGAPEAQNGAPDEVAKGPADVEAAKERAAEPVEGVKERAVEVVVPSVKKPVEEPFDPFGYGLNQGDDDGFLESQPTVEISQEQKQAADVSQDPAVFDPFGYGAPGTGPAPGGDNPGGDGERL
mmetsp:Transcript_14581/g.33742  ORF Transcript_14581/g.33742 Transcript_14581/m.33742 type:complete len:260 (-) Transcript_14581:67-846(-)